MSHLPLRKEPNCLNCNTDVVGRFCHVCGQENVVTKESFWAMTKHFVYDIAHFDGKFFHTLKHLFTKPGFVAKKYTDGKRAFYLHPIRMYLFTSAVFFLIFFSAQKIELGNDKASRPLTWNERVDLAADYEADLQRKKSDPELQRRIAMLRDTAVPSIVLDSLGWIKGVTIWSSKRDYKTIPEYDSVQKLLPRDSQDSWIESRFVRQGIRLSNKYKGRQGGEAFLSALFHKLPYFLFLSLPFFALLLKLLYVRRKSFYYSDHAVFTLYHYVLTFLLLLLIIGLGGLRDLTAWGIFRWLAVLVGLSLPVYLFIQMKNFYGQRYLKTAAKFLLLNILGMVVIISLAIIFILFSIFQV